MKLKRAGFLTKVIILALLVGNAVALLNLRGQINTARVNKQALQRQLDQQQQINSELAGVLENSDDPERQAEIARDKLGLVKPGERVIIFTD